MNPRAVICALQFAVAAAMGAPLHHQIDELIAAAAGEMPFAEVTTDAEFVRRVHLDFAGNIPTAYEAGEFIADQGRHKRMILIDRLLGADGFSQRMADAFHVILMERRGTDERWREFLVEAFKENRPWDVTVRQILSPDFGDENLAGAGYFITQRLTKSGQQPTDYPGLTRDVGRLFMGVDLQCGQCHRHLTVKDYRQVEFNGLFNVYQNLKLQNPNQKYKTKWLSENLMEKKYEFVSVFTEKRRETGPRIPFGKEIEIPELAEDEKWKVAPDRRKKVVGVPSFSPLAQIANGLAGPENPFFARNLANRVWHLLMGRGLVEPLDLMHSANPSPHPKLLDLLEREIVAHNYDLRWLVRELALTQTYQRSSRLPKGVEQVPEEKFSVAKERPVSAEQLLNAFLTAVREFDRVVKGRGKEGAEDAEAYTHEAFRDEFHAAFANAPKEPELDVSPTLRAALFLSNSDLVQWALKPRKGNLADRLMKVDDANALANELYMSVLTRMPDIEERSTILMYLQRHEHDKAKAIRQIAWSLISSIEFQTNH